MAKHIKLTVDLWLADGAGDKTGNKINAKPVTCYTNAELDNIDTTIGTYWLAETEYKDTENANGFVAELLTYSILDDLFVLPESTGP